MSKIQQLIEWTRRAIEAQLLKERIVFGCDVATAIERPPESPDYRIEKKDSAQLEASEREALTELLAPHLPAARIRGRLSQPGFHLFLAFRRADGKLAGYNWLLEPAEGGSIWHDCFEIKPGEAIVVNAFVLPEHRRRGLYTLLLAASCVDFWTRRPDGRVYTVVERRNRPAAEHNRRFGMYRAYRNFLVKFGGRNAIAVYAGRLGWRADYVYRNAKSHNS